MTKKLLNGTVALVLLFGFVFTGCNNSVDLVGKDEVLSVPMPELSAFDYVFRVVDVSGLTNGAGVEGFEELVNAHSADLQQLAAVFESNLSTAQRGRTNSVISRLAEINIIAESNREVRSMVSRLASEGVYVQFAYRDFLLGQTESFAANHSRSLHKDTVSRRTLTFDGHSENPGNWVSGHGEFIPLDGDIVTRAGNLAEINGLASLPLAEGRENIVSEYLQTLADVALSFPGAEITKQADGTFVVSIGDMTLEFTAEDELSRGLLKKITGVACIIGGGAAIIVGAKTGSDKLVTAGLWIVMGGIALLM
ncbi:MAG: hypothetical protein FWD94_05710 [Treponema sp.]|nr:hypothetical protein [Treponema sp.]